LKNRSRVEILYDIVAASKSSARKTHLMYKSNLSFKQLRMYLDFLIERGLVQERLDNLEDAGHTYAVTSKGLEFLTLFEELQGFMGVAGVVVAPVVENIPQVPAVSEILAQVP
jgi:predicted transcriptional regulator